MFELSRKFSHEELDRIERMNEKSARRSSFNSARSSFEGVGKKDARTALAALSTNNVERVQRVWLKETMAAAEMSDNTSPSRARVAPASADLDEVRPLVMEVEQRVEVPPASRWAQAAVVVPLVKHLNKAQRAALPPGWPPHLAPPPPGAADDANLALLAEAAEVMEIPTLVLPRADAAVPAAAAAAAEPGSTTPRASHPAAAHHQPSSGGCSSGGNAPAAAAAGVRRQTPPTRPDAARIAAPPNALMMSTPRGGGGVLAPCSQAMKHTYEQAVKVAMGLGGEAREDRVSLCASSSSAADERMADADADAEEEADADADVEDGSAAALVPATSSAGLQSLRALASPGFASPTTPGTALLAELLDAAAHDAVAHVARKNVVRRPPTMAMSTPPWVQRGGRSGGAASTNGVAQQQQQQHAAALQASARHSEAALWTAAELQRGESSSSQQQQQQQLELHAQLAELQLCFLQLHEQQQALVATHLAQRRAADGLGGDGVQPCACVIS